MIYYQKNHYSKNIIQNMKSILKVLLFCFIIESTLSAKRSLNMKISKVAKAIKDISSLKENNLRKLQEANESDYIDSQSDIEMGSSIDSVIQTNIFEDISSQIFESTTNSVQDTTSEISYSTNTPETNSTEKKVDNQPENISAIAENLNVSLEKPVSLKLKTTDNQDAKIQFIKFFGFHAKNHSRKASFNVYFSFIFKQFD